MGKNSASSLNYDVQCLLALGSNLEFGESGSAEVLDQAFDMLGEAGFVIRARSRYFNTPAFPAGSGPDFVNAAAVVEADMTAAQVLAGLHAVEAQMGRLRVQRWGARTLDLDLIAMGQTVLPDPQTHQYWRELPLEAQQIEIPSELVLPHPRLAERAFVLVPLLEVAPDWAHPITGDTVRAMHDALPQGLRDEVVAL
ncbi:2-amino-4-hydroxy-6-hydroxymethyldihydropteridine diphosphokinase [uncultured Sulfitobacter sp.]|uniref:2-amino-4-hydroxy-6- hydroxymethyldihydropteridine diphosphokinase n=1 Tax=uncultured Sulfitobacter sp. TaxID=191468 RepID=UPI00261A490D|nr:2-amino-4-hydroxy-6-hydroxymethyldihydropteridine diphosphokinase [uncultured Sulfitobacter sp.]